MAMVLLDLLYLTSMACQLLVGRSASFNVSKPWSDFYVMPTVHFSGLSFFIVYSSCPLARRTGIRATCILSRVLVIWLFLIVSEFTMALMLTSLSVCRFVMKLWCKCVLRSLQQTVFLVSNLQAMKKKRTRGDMLLEEVQQTSVQDQLVRANPKHSGWDVTRSNVVAAAMIGSGMWGTKIATFPNHARTSTSCQQLIFLDSLLS